MASLIGKALAKRTLRDAAQKNINSSNPFEERVEIAPGKFKTKKRGIPDGLSPNDQRVLKKVRRRAYRLDMSLFNCCGIRFGWSSVIGIVPVLGDILDCFLALMVVQSCQKIDGGLPATLRARMMFNIALDFGLGLIPLLGDVADAVFRANTRNAWLLETYLLKKMEAERVGHVSDPELGEINVPPGPGTGSKPWYQRGLSSKDKGHGQDQQQQQQQQQQQGVVIDQPVPARVHERPQPVRSLPGSRYGVPISTNGDTRRHNQEMVMSGLEYGARVGSERLLGERSSGLNEGRSQTPTAWSIPSNRQEVRKAAVQMGVHVAQDMYNSRSKSAGRR